MQTQCHARQLWTQTVVKIASKSPPLFFARRHESRPRVFEVGRQPNSMHRSSSLTHQILEQPAISGTQRLSRSPGTQDELAEAFLLVHQRQAERLRDRSSGLSGDG